MSASRLQRATPFPHRSREDSCLLHDPRRGVDERLLAGDVLPGDHAAELGRVVPEIDDRRILRRVQPGLQQLLAKYRLSVRIGPVRHAHGRRQAVDDRRDIGEGRLPAFRGRAGHRGGDGGRVGLRHKGAGALRHAGGLLSPQGPAGQPRAVHDPAAVRRVQHPLPGLLQNIAPGLRTGAGDGGHALGGRGFAGAVEGPGGGVGGAGLLLVGGGLLLGLPGHQVRRVLRVAGIRGFSDIGRRFAASFYSDIGIETVCR